MHPNPSYQVIAHATLCLRDTIKKRDSFSNMDACIRDVKELSLVYDGKSENTFVSVYFDGRDKRSLQKRERACRAVLRADELENFVKTMEHIRKHMERNRAVAIFASDKHDYVKVVPLPVPLPNMLVVDSSPYIRLLAEMTGEWESFTLILINTHHAKIFSVSCGRVTKREDKSFNVMNKHKKGGWSQARFQRLRKGSIHSFLTDVVHDVKHIAEGDIIIAGPGQAKHEFKRLLPESMQRSVIAMFDSDMDDEQHLFSESLVAMAEMEWKEQKTLLAHIRRELLRDGLAAYGIDETLEAAREGKVEVLLIERGYKERGWICEHCQNAGRGDAEHCPVCGGRTSQVDIIEEIVEFAERTDAIIEFTDEEELRMLGHVAALLRYR